MQLTKATCSYAKNTIVGLLALLLATCKDDDPKPEPETFTVAFELNGGAGSIDTQTVEQGKNAIQPPAPNRQGYTFLGWFTDIDLQNAFAFTTPVTTNIMVYAKWERRPEKFWIPDDNFRNALKVRISEAFDDRDSLLTQHPDVTGRIALNIASSSIADLTGITYFTALTELYCNDNQLTALDVSQNTALTTLDCAINQLIALDLSRNLALIALDCSGNQLATLGLSQNAALTTLDCSVNQLAMLDVSLNAALTALNCSENQLVALALSQNAALTALDGSINQLTALDLSRNVALTALYCSDNQLSELDIRGMRAVDTLAIDAADKANPLDSLKAHRSVQNHNAIKEAKTRRGDTLTIATYRAEDGSTAYTLVCGDYDPNVEKCLFTVIFEANEGGETQPQTVQEGSPAVQPRAPTRKDYLFAGWFTDPAFRNAFHFNTPIAGDLTLYARWEPIPEKFLIPDKNFRDTLKAQIPAAFDERDSLLTQHADVKGLATLNIASSSIADLTGIAYFTALKELVCSDNRLNDLNVSQNAALMGLRCNENQLTSLNVSQNTALTTLVCSDNQLTTLDISQNVDLAILGCSGNQLTRLEVSKNLALAFLECYANRLTTLDVSEHPSLTELLCHQNELVSLDISQSVALRRLDCHRNKLMTLDVAQNTNLTNLACYENDLTSLDVSQNTALAALICHANLLTALDVSQNTALTTLRCHDNQLTDLDMRGMRLRRFDALQIDVSSTSSPLLRTLKTHESLQDHDELKEVKTQRGVSVSIETYEAAGASTAYTLVCGDYDPNAGSCLSVTRTALVAFRTNGGSAVDARKTPIGQPASQPTDPIRQDYTFVGWFTDSALQNAFDFTAPVNADFILYAQWVPESVEGLFYIPDGNFRNHLKSLLGNDAFDKLDRLRTQRAEVTQRAALSVNNLAIADLTGIAFFTSLTFLNCSDNQLTSLDLSKNTALTSLVCSDNHAPLASMDISKNTLLTMLDCYNAQLTNLDVSQNTRLTELDCSANQLKSLNVSQNVALTRLSCGANQLTSLNVSQNRAMITLLCSENQLTSLDLSKNVLLTVLRCHGNQLTDLDMRGMRSVNSGALQIDASADFNPLSALKVHENLQGQSEIREVKTQRDADVVVETYSAAAGSTDYAPVCGDYNPNAGSCAATDSE